MTRSDMRHYSIALLVPLCFASAAAVVSGHRGIAYAIDAAMAFVFVDWLMGDLSVSWTWRRSMVSTAGLAGLSWVAGYGVMGMIA